jgi:hypothetical protein
MDTNEAKAVADRREFLKQAGKVAVTAPAVALLLNATTVPAKAVVLYGPPDV